MWIYLMKYVESLIRCHELTLSVGQSLHESDMPTKLSHKGMGVNKWNAVDCHNQ